MLGVDFSSRDDLEPVFDHLSNITASAQLLSVPPSEQLLTVAPMCVHKTVGSGPVLVMLSTVFDHDPTALLLSVTVSLDM